MNKDITETRVWLDGNASLLLRIQMQESRLALTNAFEEYNPLAKKAAELNLYSEKHIREIARVGKVLTQMENLHIHPLIHSCRCELTSILQRETTRLKLALHDHTDKHKT